MQGCHCSRDMGINYAVPFRDLPFSRLICFEAIHIISTEGQKFYRISKETKGVIAEPWQKAR